MESKSGQISLFVVVGIVIVVAAIIVFIFVGNPFERFVGDENPKERVESLVYGELETITVTALENNGYINPIEDNFIVYYGERVPYLCTVSEFYTPCMPQEPMFVGKIKTDLENYLQPLIEDEFSDIKKDLESRGYKVSFQNPEVEVSFKEEEVLAKVNGNFVITKGETTEVYDEFNVEIKSSFYKLISLAQTIVNYESTLCEFDKLKWQALHTDVKIERFRASDQTKVYTIKDLDTEEELKFAVKTCVLPAGI